MEISTMRDRRQGGATKKKVRAEDIKSPRIINDDDFENICSTFHFRADAAKFLKKFLDDFVETFADNISSELRSPTMPADRERLKKALSAIKKAKKKFARPVGPAGRQGLDAFGHILGPALSARWLREQNPKANLPQRMLYDGPGDFRLGDRAVREQRLPVRPAVGRRYDVEDLSINERIRCVSGQPLETAHAFLSLVENALTKTLSDMLLLPGARGGQRPLVSRCYGLANLAKMWHELGRDPTSGANSEFFSFCELIFDAVGWPIDGLQDAIPDAITLWRNLTGNIKR
jgi:hypothetical protein